MIYKTFFLLLSLIALVTASACYTDASADLQRGLPSFINVTDYGNIHRQQFPVTGGIPIPRGALAEGSLSRLALFSADGQRQIPAQSKAIGKWPDGSTKWLLMDFQSTQDAGSTVQYKLQLVDTPDRDLPYLARENANGVEIDTGRLKDGKTAIISIRDGEGWWEVTDGSPVSRIGVRQREMDTPTQYILPLVNAAIETNGPMKAIIKFEGWHTAGNGDEFSPSVVRLTFYKAQSFVRVHHTFVNSKNPDTHLITDISVEMPLAAAMDEALYSMKQKARSIAIGDDRCAIFQENLARPTYPPSHEFEGRFRVFSGDEVVAEGRRYSEAMVLRSKGLSAGVFLKDIWQMSPKTLAYDPAIQMLQV